MVVDKFTRINSEKLADEAAVDEFKVDFCAESVFNKNPTYKVVESEMPKPKKGILDFIVEKLEVYIDKNKKKSKTARKFKAMLHFFKVKDTLNRLNKINQSVDELVNLKVPFGEQDKRYEVLANRLIRANHLHTEIQKELS